MKKNKKHITYESGVLNYNIDIFTKVSFFYFTIYPMSITAERKKNKYPMLPH